MTLADLEHLETLLTDPLPISLLGEIRRLRRLAGEASYHVRRAAMAGSFGDVQGCVSNADELLREALRG